MRRRTWYLLGAAAALAVVAGAFALPYFLPEEGRTVREDAPIAVVGTEVLGQGSFRGEAGHHVSGTVKLLLVDGVAYLRFENYSQTQGPDVYVYLTPSAMPDTNEEVQAGVRILLDGGAGAGESTQEGDFNQRLPDGLDLASFRGVAVWCDRFNVPFGYATLG